MCILLISTLFVLLAANMSLDDFALLDWRAIVLLLVVLFVLRPIGAQVSALGSTLTKNERLLLSWIAPRGIGQNDNRRLKAFGTMYRHDPDSVTGAVHLTFDFKVVGFHPDQKPGQAIDCALLIGHRLGQKRINAILGLLPKTREKLLAPVMARQNPLDKIIGAQEIGVIAQVVQYPLGFWEFRAAVT